MKNEIEAMITDITATTAEAEDYTGETGFMLRQVPYAKSILFKRNPQWLGHDRHLANSIATGQPVKSGKPLKADRTLKQWRT